MVRAVTLKVSEFLAVVAPHLSWFPCGYHRSSSTGNLVGVARYRQSVDVKVSHHRLDVVDSKFRAVDARHSDELVVVGESLQKDVFKPLVRDPFSHFMQSPSHLK